MTHETVAELDSVEVRLVVGNIVEQQADAIVNAANTSLLGGGGVDGAIHRAAGPRLLQETSKLGGCKTGNAKITDAYNLPAKYVIHAVGPVYRQNNDTVAKLLTSAYERSLELAAEHDASRVAFPAISTGVYRYPLEEAAEIALSTTVGFIEDRTRRAKITEVRFVLFSDSTFEVFEKVLRRIAQRHPDLNLV